VFVLITEETLEENLLTTLSAKHELALAALDAESDVNAVDLSSGTDDLKKRLEVLLGAKPEAPLDDSVKRRQEREAAELSHRERVAAAGGELLGAAFRFLGELVADQVREADGAGQLANDLRDRLGQCVEEDGTGQQRLTVTLPDRAALDGLASALARLLAVGNSPRN
jgi:hypothetical protein